MFLKGAIHFVQQPKLQITALRSNGIYHAVNATPLSSSRQVPSITSATTTTTRSNIKSNALFFKKKSFKCYLLIIFF